MDRRGCFNYLVDRISRFESEGEARSIAYILMEEMAAVARRDLIVDPRCEVGSMERIESALAELERGVPLEHITGHREFYGREFRVSPQVLIPRPETEELVKLALERCSVGRVLDIGTGSGAIAITLALESRGLRVSGYDISEGALAQARENCRLLRVDVEFSRCDILSEEIVGEYDMIVSNPPYIRESERGEMSAKVYDHEPLIALFVDDSDPLLFYRVIAEKALVALSSGGWLLFEINEALGGEMRELLESMGFSDVEIREDLFGKDRIACCRLLRS